MTDLAAFLTARLDEDEMWAREASRRNESPIVEGGVHWQWEDADSDEIIALDPGTMTYVDDDRGSASLRSVEEFKTHSVGLLPQFALGNVEEVPICVGGHIARWDPARVLAEITAKRRVLARHQRMGSVYPNALVPDACEGCGLDEGEWNVADINECPELLDLAAPFSGHEDFDESWRT